MNELKIIGYIGLAIIGILASFAVGVKIFALILGIPLQ